MQKNRWFKFLCSVLSVSVVLTCAPLNKYADSVPETQTYSVIENLHFEVDASITSFWDNYANLEFTISNTGSETIHNWHLTFDLPYSIEGVWGAEVFERSDDGSYTIKNAGWNQDILPESSVSFGMTVSTSDGQPVSELPTIYLLNTVTKTVDASDYSLSYQEYANWGTGYNGSLVLTNLSDESIEDWNLSFVANRDIAEVADAELEISGNTVIVSNGGENQNIGVTESKTMTITGGERNIDASMTISDVCLTTVVCAYGLTEDNDLNGIPDYKEFISSHIQVPEVTPTPTPSETPTPTSEPDPTVTPDVTIVPTSEPTPSPCPDLDSDGDGISDALEIELGTDPDSKDSDSDGVDDNIEVMLGLDPLSGDSDGDGIPDPQEDGDSDGLTLQEEIEQETYPWTDDSDVDGLSDGDECHIHGTNPLNEDTDGDGIEDGDEIKLGTDPLIPDSDGDGIPDGQERFLQTREEELNNEERPVVDKVEVTLEGTGCLDSVMAVEDVYGKDRYSSDLVGLVGVPVEIEYAGDFDEATITFHYDEEMLASSQLNLTDSTMEDMTVEDDLGILWLDEESGFYVDCDAQIDKENNELSCTVTHFSEYMVYNKRTWDYRWKYELDNVSIPLPTNRDETGNLRGKDYYLMFQYDASMTDVQRQAQHDFVHAIIDNMGPNDRVQYLCMTDNWLVGPFDKNLGFVPVSDKQIARDYYDQLLWTEEISNASACHFGQDCVATEVCWAYMMARSRNSNVGNNGNEVVSICFGNTITNSNYTLPVYKEYRKICDSYLVSDFYILLPNGTIEYPKLKNLDQWGGGIIEWDRVNDAYQEFVRLYTLYQGEDLDGDGLWDVHETAGMVATNGKIYYSDPRTRDSDNDGLTDSEEMGSSREILVNKAGELYVDGDLVCDKSTSVSKLKDPRWIMYCRFIDYGPGRWKVYNIVSDPMEKDTDGDYYSDVNDPQPKTRNIQILGLTGEYDISEYDHYYVGVYNYPNAATNDTSYGGNQGWFRMPNVRKDEIDDYISENGCGLIAFSDIYFYLFDNRHSMDFVDYYTYVRRTKDAFGSAATPLGLFFGSMCDALKVSFKDSGYSCDVYAQPIDTNNPVKSLNSIVKMLQGFKPVIMSLCANHEIQFYNISSISSSQTQQIGDSGLCFKSAQIRTTHHYYTITGIIYDDILDEAFLRISSWGKEYYIKYSEYVDVVRNYRVLGIGPITGINYSKLLKIGWDVGNFVIIID